MTDPSTPPVDTGIDGSRTEPDEGPVTTGTLFIMILFLMALAGLWVLMYLILLDR
jgi:hypothetical protein